ncbi:MAG: PepSY domain-containing protein [Defluviitaleaceae bacterium]|nr:PepSY domain-containing protein [Defluviitaleaceae bacterium]
MNKKYLVLPLALITIGTNAFAASPNTGLPSDLGNPSFQNNYNNSNYGTREHRNYGYGTTTDGYRRNHNYRTRERENRTYEQGTYKYRNDQYKNREYKNKNYENYKQYNPTISLNQAMELAYQDLSNRGVTAVFRKDYGIDYHNGRLAWKLKFRPLENTNRGEITHYIDIHTGEIINFGWDGM